MYYAEKLRKIAEEAEKTKESIRYFNSYEALGKYLLSLASDGEFGCTVFLSDYRKQTFDNLKYNSSVVSVCEIAGEDDVHYLKLDKNNKVIQRSNKFSPETYARAVMVFISWEKEDDVQ